MVCKFCCSIKTLFDGIITTFSSIVLLAVVVVFAALTVCAVVVVFAALTVCADDDDGKFATLDDDGI